MGGVRGGPAEPLRRSTALLAGRRGVASLALAVLVTAAVTHAIVADHRFLDLEVYRLGGRAWLSGIDLYGSDLPHPPHAPRLPFTYPPAAAVFFSPLSLVPLAIAAYAAIIATIAGAGVVLRVALRATSRAAVPSPAFLAGVVGACLLLEPIRHTISFGQINVYLMALVVLDCFVVPRRFRGFLTGLAGAVKLTPLGFLLFFLVDRDWRALRNCVLGFLGVTALGFLVAPGSSWTYWTSTLGNARRIGNPGYPTNQSVRGLLTRFLVPAPWATLLLLGLALVFAWLTYRAARALLRDGRRLAALVLVADWCLLVSPVSWTHHWVWVLPGLVAVAAPGFLPRMHRAIALVVLGGTFTLAPVFWAPGLPHSVAPWSTWEAVYGNAYIWVGMVAIIAAAAPTFRRAAVASGGGEPAVADMNA